MCALSESDEVKVRKVIHEIRDSRDTKNSILDDDEKQQLENLRDQAVIEAFETHKQLLKEKYPDFVDIIDENVQSGYDLELWSEKLEEMHRETQTRNKPKGQAVLEPEKKSGSSTVYQAETSEELIKNLYDQTEELMFKRDTGRPYSEEKLRTLNKMRDKLLGSLLEGQKSHGVASAGRWSVWQCLCGQVNVNSNKCSKCGFENRSKTTVKGVVNYV